jgi:hypothetical protein
LQTNLSRLSPSGIFLTNSAEPQFEQKFIEVSIIIDI